MRRNLSAYLILWLPAFLVNYFYAGDTPLSHALQWGTAGLVLLGWPVVTGVACYKRPIHTAALWMLYTGGSALQIALLYTVPPNADIQPALRRWLGLFSYRTLEILSRALADFSVPHELLMLALIAVLCAVGYLIGLVLRRIRPDPYKPRVMKM